MAHIPLAGAPRDPGGPAGVSRWNCRGQSWGLSAATGHLRCNPEAGVGPGPPRWLTL